MENKISVIIPARNEEKNIKKVINLIKKQQIGEIKNIIDYEYFLNEISKKNIQREKKKEIQEERIKKEKLKKKKIRRIFS